MGCSVARARVILVLREYIWNAPTVPLVLPAFDGTDSLGSLSQMVSGGLSPWFYGSILGNCFPFSCGK